MLYLYLLIMYVSLCTSVCVCVCVYVYVYVCVCVSVCPTKIRKDIKQWSDNLAFLPLWLFRVASTPRIIM